MTNHFTAIGFPIYNVEDMKAWANEALEHGETISVENGRYVRWQAGAGAELWVQTDVYGMPYGINPHFGEDSFVAVGVTQLIHHPKSSPLDGAFFGWADPHEDDPSSGFFPFVFDAPDTAVHSHVQLPKRFDVQLTAFAHDLTIFASETTYNESQGDEPKLATISFFPTGTFVGEGETPSAHAVFTGHIADWALRRNPATQLDFYWLRVQTLGGVIDVVAAAGMIEDEPVAGGIAQGSFWLSGRLLL